MQIFKLFVSSPGDVMVERRRVENVVSRLNGEFAGVARLEAIRWETEFYQAYSTFQAQIPRSTDCDIVIGILRWRLGTELPPDFSEKLPGNQPFPSGTAYEILTAIAKRQQGGALPDVYVFRFAGSSPAVPVDDPNRGKIEHDWAALKSFFEQWFLTARGHFKAAFNPYNSEDDFEEQLEKLLRKWVADKVAGGRVVRWPVEVKGSPFCGLAAFGAKHAAVFFGRNDDIARAVDLWRETGTRGSPYLLVVGASGSGKSSLARAGLVPRLTTPGVIKEVDAWRVAVMRPGDSPTGPFAALAAALLQDDADLAKEEEGRGPALPEIAQGNSRTPAELAGVLQHADAAAIKPIVNALARVGAAEHDREKYSREVRCDLVLLIDQFEELFAGSVSEAERNAFIDLMAQLVGTGRIWLVTTLRADFYARMLDQPALKKLKELGATYDLAPPGPVELAEIVRAPAEAAGLVFETDAMSGERLDTLVLRDADRPDMLPLVQLALSRLFEARETVGGDVVLPLKVYNSLGGLKGIINEAGERALASAGDAAIVRLPQLLRQLAVPARDQDGAGKGALTVRSVPLALAAPDEPGRELVDALVDARLLTTAGTDADAQVRLTHQRVLEDWSRARTIVAESTDFYRIRADLEESRQKWESGQRRKELLLPRGLPLAEAASIVGKYGNELTPETLAYVSASRRRAQRAQMVGWGLAAFFFVLALTAVGSAFKALQARREAIRAQQQTEAALAASEQRQHSAVVGLANESINSGDVATGMLHALNVLDATAGDAKLASAAERALFAGVQKLRENVFIDAQTDPHAVFSPDGLRVASISANNTATIWDAKTGEPIYVLLGHRGAVDAVAFNVDGQLLITASIDGTAIIWDAATGTARLRLAGHSGPVTDVAFSGDSQRVMTRSGDEVRVWEAKTGNAVSVIKLPRRAIQSVAFSPDGHFVATGLKDTFTGNFPHDAVIIWDATSGKSVAQLVGHNDWVMGATYSTDGKLLATMSWDNTVRVWNVREGIAIAVLQGHTGRVASAVFSPDGRQLLTGSSDKTARLWDIGTSRTIRTFEGHTGSIENVAFSPDGQRSLTASDDRTARLWDNETGQLITVFGNHDGKVERAAFSMDGSRVLTSSTDRSARIWQVQAGAASKAYTRHTGKLMTSGFSPDGRLAVTASWDKTAQIWDVETEATDLVLIGHKDVVSSAKFSPDGNRVVTASWDQTAKLWDAKTGTLLVTLTGHTNGVNSAEFSPDGHDAVTASSDGTVRIWDSTSGRQVKVFAERGSGSMRKAVYSPDGRHIATASDDRIARIWDSGTGTMVKKFIGHRSGLKDIAFSPDGHELVTAADDGTARIWEIATAKEIAMLPSPNAVTVFSAGFSPDGTRVITASDDTYARIWDWHTQTIVAVLSGHGEAVWGSVFSPNGEKVLSASWDNTARIWAIDKSREALVVAAKDAVPRCLSNRQINEAYATAKETAKEDVQKIVARDSSWCIAKQKGWYQTQYSKNWLRSQVDPDYKACATNSETKSIIAGCDRLLARSDQSWTTIAWALHRRGGAYLKRGDSERAARDFAALLGTAERGLVGGHGPILQEKANHVWPSDLYSPTDGRDIVDTVGGGSFGLILTRQFQPGLDAADLALELIPDFSLALGNRAHALMFLGRTKEASDIYLGKHNSLIGGKTWQQSTLADFADFRKAGLTNPLMDEVEKAFAVNK